MAFFWLFLWVVSILAAAFITTSAFLFVEGKIAATLVFVGLALFFYWLLSPEHFSTELMMLLYK